MYDRKIWQFNRADVDAISRAISHFPWQRSLHQIFDPSSQVTLLNDTILNVMSNFVPNKTIKIKPSEPEWINRQIKTMLKKQNRLYKRYKNNGFQEVDKVNLDVFRKECDEAIEKSKRSYL